MLADVIALPSVPSKNDEDSPPGVLTLDMFETADGPPPGVLDLSSLTSG